MNAQVGVCNQDSQIIPCTVVCQVTWLISTPYEKEKDDVDPSQNHLLARQAANLWRRPRPVLKQKGVPTTCAGGKIPSRLRGWEIPDPCAVAPADLGPHTPSGECREYVHFCRGARKRCDWRARALDDRKVRIYMSGVDRPLTGVLLVVVFFAQPIDRCAKTVQEEDRSVRNWATELALSPIDLLECFCFKSA